MVDPLAIILVFGYTATLILYISQILSLFLSHSNKICLRSGILYFLGLSCLVRIVFWIEVHSDAYINLNSDMSFRWQVQ